MRPRRIAVVGGAGTGKSTFARRLADALGLPVVHLDTLYWHPGWRESTVEEFRGRHDEAIAREEWVIDGNYTAGGKAERLARADAVVVMDAPLAACLWRVVRRRIVNHGKSRPDMTEGCPEHLDAKFFTFIVRWKRRHRDYPAEIRALVPGKPVYVVRTRAEADAVVERLRG